MMETPFVYFCIQEKLAILWNVAHLSVRTVVSLKPLVLNPHQHGSEGRSRLRGNHKRFWIVLLNKSYYTKEGDLTCQANNHDPLRREYFLRISF